MFQSHSKHLLFRKKVSNIGPFLTILVIKWNTIHDVADISVYTKMHVFLYQLFQASNRSSFMINISLVSKNVI